MTYEQCQAKLVGMQEDAGIYIGPIGRSVLVFRGKGANKNDYSAEFRDFDLEGATEFIVGLLAVQEVMER